MPKEIHNKLAKQARKKGLTGKQYDKYVYGTMAQIEQRKKYKDYPKKK